MLLQKKTILKKKKKNYIYIWSEQKKMSPKKTSKDLVTTIIFLHCRDTGPLRGDPCKDPPGRMGHIMSKATGRQSWFLLGTNGLFRPKNDTPKLLCQKKVIYVESYFLGHQNPKDGLAWHDQFETVHWQPLLRSEIPGSGQWGHLLRGSGKNQPISTEKLLNQFEYQQIGKSSKKMTIQNLTKSISDGKHHWWPTVNG